MSRQEKRALTINLGSGVRLEVVYFSMESIDIDEIEHLQGAFSSALATS